MEALVGFPRAEALDFLEPEVSPGLEDSLELEELEDGQELEDTHHREAKEVTLPREAKEAIPHKEVREVTLHRGVKEDTHRKEVREVIPHKEVREDTPHREVREAIPLKEVRVLLLLLLLVVDLIPQPQSQPLRNPPHPRDPLVPAPPTLTPAVLANITPSDTMRTALWPLSSLGSRGSSMNTKDEETC